MPTTRCTNCNSVLTEEESRLSSCPACGGAPYGDPGPASHSASFVLGIVGILGAAVVAGSLVVWTAWTRRDHARVTAERLPAPTIEEPLAQRVVAEVLTPPEVEQDDTPRAEELPTPEVEKEVPPRQRLEALPAPQVEAAAEQPKGREVLEGNDLIFDRPEGEVVLAAIDGDEKTTLSGRVKTLTFESINGKVVIDASKLNAERVIVKGEINGSTKVILHGADIEFAGPVNGDVDIIADAPDGKVAFTNSAAINGSCRINVNARKASFKGLVGGIRVRVTLSPGGGLAFAYTDGGAVLEYRKASGKDAEPKISKGDVKGGSRFGQIKGDK